MIKKLICFFWGHNKVKKYCSRCGAYLSVPKMDKPIPAPPKHKHKIGDTNWGSLETKY